MGGAIGALARATPRVYVSDFIMRYSSAAAGALATLAATESGYGAD